MTINVLLTIRKVELIVKKMFRVAAFNPEYKTFVIYIAALSVDLGSKVHLLKMAQIGHLKVDEAPTEVLSEYTNLTDVFY